MYILMTIIAWAFLHIDEFQRCSEVIFFTYIYILFSFVAQSFEVTVMDQDKGSV